MPRGRATLQDDMRALAATGARARVEELERMITDLKTRYAFAFIGNGTTTRLAPVSNTAIAPRRRRRKLSAAMRKRISEVQKARWEKWRAKKAAKAGKKKTVATT